MFYSLILVNIYIVFNFTLYIIYKIYKALDRFNVNFYRYINLNLVLERKLQKIRSRPRPLISLQATLVLV
jgi:hypothetical protein